jgi:hypothetical protein
MNRISDQSRMREAFREITRDLVGRVIEIAEIENGQVRYALVHKGDAALNMQRNRVNRMHLVSVESFINARTPRERAELASLMIVGREPYHFSVSDIEITVKPEFWRDDLGEYLASKGAGLARYLTRGMEVVGL